MALFHTLRDDFSGTLGSWPAATGSSIVSGRARVTCDTGFNGIRSAATYTLDESKVCAEVYVAPATTATVEATTELLVLTTTGGLDAGFSYNAVGNQLSLISRSGFFDPSPTVLTYDSTAHRWWRLREASGTLHWETSPDGSTWTSRRTATSPGWVTDTTLTAAILSHRNNGTANFAEADNFNMATIRAAASASFGFTATAAAVRTVVVSASAAFGFTATAAAKLTVKARAVADFGFTAVGLGVSSTLVAQPPPPAGQWRFLIGPPTGGYDHALTRATSRRLTVRLKDPSEVGFTIDGRADEALLLDELTTDVHILWRSPEGDDRILFRGRIGATSDTLTADSHQMTVTALDYRAMLHRRRLLGGTPLNANWTFESGISPWGAFVGTTIESDDQTAHDGKKSMKIIPDGLAPLTGVFSDNVPVDQHKVYRFSCWARRVGGGPIDVQIDWKDAANVLISSDTITITLVAEAWTKLDVDNVAPPLAVEATMVVEMAGTPAATDFLNLDDARFTTTPHHASRLSFYGVEQADIAWALIDDTQARIAGDLGISNGAAATGVQQNLSFQWGDSIGEQLDKLAQTEAGFDWDIVPISESALSFQVWHEERGVNRGVVLEYGGLMAGGRREVQPSTYANAVRMTGDNSTEPQEREAEGLAGLVQGRFDAVYADTSLVTQDSLDGRIHWQHKESQVLRPTWSVVLKRGSWLGPDHIWVGDPVRLIPRSGRLRQVDTTLRVYEISFAIDDDGGETVTLTLGNPPPDYRRMPLLQDRRLTNLERR